MFKGQASISEIMMALSWQPSVEDDLMTFLRCWSRCWRGKGTLINYFIGRRV